MNSIIDLNEKRKQKQAAEAIGRGRIPLSVSHGKVESRLSGVVFGNEPGDAEFTARMQRIRTSLEKINQLMTELKQNHKID